LLQSFVAEIERLREVEYSKEGVLPAGDSDSPDSQEDIWKARIEALERKAVTKTLAIIVLSVVIVALVVQLWRLPS
jgi:hypothetical protein